MRTSQICPTCTTYINSLCVIYNGTYLANINASPLDTLDKILANINTATGVINSSVASINTSIIATNSSITTLANSVIAGLALKEDVANKVTTQATFISNGTSVSKYPAIKAVKDYIDGVTAGLLQDNGQYDPTITSNYPTSANTLSGGPVQVGDLWYISANGTINGNAVLIGYSVRALINAAGPTTDADWAIANVGIGFVPENSANKSTDGTFNSGSPSSVLFPTQSAVATYITANAQTLDQVLTNGNTGTSDLVIGNTLTTPTTSTLLSPGTVQLQSPTLGTAVFAVDGITLDDATATNQMVIMYNNNNQTIDFPDTSGTLALVETSAFTGSRTINSEVFTWVNGILISVV